MEHMETQETSAALIHLHIAEYQSLTTRQSYWMILQISLVPIIPIYLALALDMWIRATIPGKILTWGTLAGLQLLGYLWAQTMVEYYTSVRYVECVLRPLIKRIVDTDLFWGYEPHLSAHRHTSPLSWELSFPILAAVLFATTTALRYWTFKGWFPFWDIFGAIINLCLLAALWRHCLTAVRIRREWSTCDKDVVKQLEATTQSVHPRD
jgi:hypothetical protein